MKKVQRLFNNRGCWFGQAYQGEFLLATLHLIGNIYENALMKAGAFELGIYSVHFIGFSSSET